MLSLKVNEERMRKMAVEVFSPVGEQRITRRNLTGRDKNLEGKSVVLLGNGKPNVDLLFDSLEELLRKNVCGIRVLRKVKANAAFAAPEEFLQETAAEVDYLIYGVAD